METIFLIEILSIKTVLQIVMTHNNWKHFVLPLSQSIIYANITPFLPPTIKMIGKFIKINNYYQIIHILTIMKNIY